VAADAAVGEVEDLDALRLADHLGDEFAGDGV